MRKGGNGDGSSPEELDGHAEGCNEGDVDHEGDIFEEHYLTRRIVAITLTLLVQHRVLLSPPPSSPGHSSRPYARVIIM